MYFILILLHVFCLLREGVCEYGQLSKQKCREYSKALYKQENSSQFDREYTDFLCHFADMPLILGGTWAIAKEYPHMGVIGYGDDENSKNITWLCGCSLISEIFVLTAAHCVITRRSPVKVRLGLVDLYPGSEDFNADTLQERNIVKMIVHPEYRRSRKYNDIALLELDKVVEFTSYVQPACLNTNFHLQEDVATATGYGKLHYDTDVGSQLLMKVSLHIYPNEQCQKYFPNIRGMEQGVTDAMICAGDLVGGRDTCQGDSGGPLQVVLEEYCMYSIIGVTSFGRFCGFPNSPAIYTNVSHYIPWIESVAFK